MLNIFRNTTDEIIMFSIEDSNKTSVDENVQSILVQNDRVNIDVIVTVYIALLLCFELTLPYIRSQDVNISGLINKKNLKRIAALLILTVISPLIMLILILCLIYKSICRSVIKRSDKFFVNYLDSFDVFWSLDDDASNSIINILGVVEAESAIEIADKIKQKLLKEELNNTADKIFYRRNEKFGFYYWRKYETVDIDQYIKVLDHKTDAEYLNDTDLEVIMELVNDGMLPYDNEGLFQIIITNPKLYANNNLNEYAIIFRIHHAVGDGVALIKFLCKSLANDTDCEVKLFSDSHIKSSKCSLKLLTDMMKTLCQVPLCFIDGIVRESDNNILHGPVLSGNKIFKWINDDKQLLQDVKDIKDNVDGMKFTDVLMAALATSLRNYIRQQKNSNTPEELAVVLPIRFAQPAKHEEDFKLDNDFSVTILDLPITSDDGLREIQLRCNATRKSADPITNYYFLKLVGELLPKPLLQPLLTSSQATMIFSNMPGPETIYFCEGNELKKLVFFVPHKGTTGLGITALSYGGVLRFGAMADKALVKDPEDLALILTGMETAIRRLHQEVIGGRRF